jgi:hypothetical protein
MLFVKILQISRAVAAMRKMVKKRKSIFTIMDSMMKKVITILLLETTLLTGMRLLTSWEKDPSVQLLDALITRKRDKLQLRLLRIRRNIIIRQV